MGEPNGPLAAAHVVVVGGSGGIGLATAHAAAGQGATVTLVARDAGRLARAAAVVRAQQPGAVVDTAVGDVADEDVIGAALAALPPADHVYVAAGTAGAGSILAEAPVADQVRVIDERLRGAIHVVRACAGRMPPGGSFVFTGGLSTDRPVPGAWASGVGTAAVEQLARVLALDLAPLRFNAVSPGWTDTPMWDRLLGAGKPEVFRAVADKTPIRRLAAADEVAAAVVFLMANRAVTGEVLHVDGGQRLT